jgi:hypothetical protein
VSEWDKLAAETLQKQAREHRNVMPDDKIQREFEAFHLANPHVYRTLARLARQYSDRVGTTPGIGMLWEAMRWTVTMETRTVDFKLNNNYRSRYARLLMEQEADLADAFETRRLRAA